MGKGLSLVELLIVLAIIAALVFLGIPTYGKFYSFIQIWSDGRRFTSDLREYHQRAISEKFDYRFTGLSPTSYKIEYYDEVEGWKLIKTVELNKEVYFDSYTYSSFTFRPLGNVTPSGTNTIVIKNNEGETSTITINSTTGHVSIQ